MTAQRKPPNILVVPKPDEGRVDYVWDESGITISLSQIQENHAGLVAFFSAECPIGTEVLSALQVHPERLSDRRQVTSELLKLPLPYKEWAPLVEYAFAHCIRTWQDIKRQQADEIPEALFPDDILALPTPEPTWLVPDIMVAVGVSILASLPKKGKTVFAMNMVRAGQDNVKFLDRDVPDVPFLFLALEDPWRRLKHRMGVIGIKGRRSPFVTQCDLTKGLEPLAKLVDKYQPRAVVLDTLLAGLRVKDENSPELGITVQGLSDFAKERTLSFLILHHHGKTRRDDPVADLRGHTSLSGAVDVILGLYAEETAGQFKLKSASRDGEPLDLDLAYDGNSLSWRIDTNYSELQKIENISAMIELLRELGPVPADTIGNANGKSRTANDKVLKRLMESGDVIREPQKVGYQTTYVYRLSKKPNGALGV
jgi:hypothetical protein